MPTITVNGQQGTINLVKDTQYTITFTDFGGWYGGKTKWLYDMNRAIPLLLWSGDADNITLSSGNVDATLTLRAFDYCSGTPQYGNCFYASNDIVVIIGLGGAEISKCPRGDAYLRDLFAACDPGYTLAPGFLQNECQCQDALAKGRISPKNGKTDWGTIILIGVGVLTVAYIATSVIKKGGKK